MPYPRHLLNPHEEVAIDLHPHWGYHAPPAVALVAAIAAGIATLVLTGAGTTERAVLGWLSLLAILAAVVGLVTRYVRWANTHFVITNDRIIFRRGVMSRSGIEIPLESVNAVHFEQSVRERLVGAGNLIIESGSIDGRQVFTDIDGPERVQREIHAQMEVNEQRRFRSVGSDRPVDVATQLEKLEGMLERGTLSRREFDEHKERLLGW
ncbi:PH domain-containing protein [Ilumatobacter sp.]|uniref:PH domain-containing protein n=1 Tax=Ilumatobacter sp. TaxID=1967498 RepID=UPI003B518BF9